MINTLKEGGVCVKELETTTEWQIPAGQKEIKRRLNRGKKFCSCRTMTIANRLKIQGVL